MRSLAEKPELRNIESSSRNVIGRRRVSGCLKHSTANARETAAGNAVPVGAVIQRWSPGLAASVLPCRPWRVVQQGLGCSPAGREAVQEMAAIRRTIVITFDPETRSSEAALPGMVWCRLETPALAKRPLRQLQVPKLQSTAVISASGFFCAIAMPNTPWPAAISSTLIGPVPAIFAPAIVCAGIAIMGAIARANRTQNGLSGFRRLLLIAVVAAFYATTIG